MDFRFTGEERNLQKQIADFAAKQLPPGWEGGIQFEEYTGDLWPVTREIARKLGRQGWLGMGWGQEYGGTPRSLMCRLIFYEEAVYHRIPAYDMGIGGVSCVAPPLAAFGTEEQKNRHLRDLAAGLKFWCVGYSEPDIGSDLPSLHCQALPADGGYVIRGSKIWTSAAQAADWCFLLARTGEPGSKHRGLTIFLVDMRSKGLTRRPIKDICGVPSLNQLFFDDVYVESANVLGQIDKAWDNMPLLLFMERTFQSGAASGRCRRLLDDTVQYCRNTPRVPSVSRGVNRNRLADLCIEVEVGRLLTYRAVWLEQQGPVPEAATSAARAYTSRMEQRTAQAVMQVLGPFGQLKTGSPSARLRGQAEHFYLSCISDSILGGTGEIQRNIIASKGLALPRG